MEIKSSPLTTDFYQLVNPTPASIGNSVETFLAQLPGPTHILISGNDSSRQRMLVTLIHGNEPSGFYAIYKFIQDGIRPAVDMHFVIPSVIAAQAQPLFSHRMLPNHRDLNRCFFPPFDQQSESQLAQQVIALIEAVKPEAVVDLHNTSGSGPDFAVTTYMHPHHDAVLSLFTQRSVLTELRLGALMELSTPELPIVTVECGGSHDHESHALAYHGLQRYALADNIQQTQAINLDVYQHPIRVELSQGAIIAYDDEIDPEATLTLVSHIEDFNFGIVDKDTVLGFTNTSDLTCLQAKSSNESVQITDYFQVSDRQLRPCKALKLFMVTTNQQIAQSDCLFYFVTVGENLATN